IDTLSKIFSPKKTTFAEISFSDVPGEHGAERKGLSTKALTQIREQDALCLVLRDFTSAAIEGNPDPLRDLEAFHMECVFADLDLVERRIDRARREKAAKQEIDVFERLKHSLDEGQPLRAIPSTEVDRAPLRGYSFLTD